MITNPPAMITANEGRCLLFSFIIAVYYLSFSHPSDFRRQHLLAAPPSRPSPQSRLGIPFSSACRRPTAARSPSTEYSAGSDGLQESWPGWSRKRALPYMCSRATTVFRWLSFSFLGPLPVENQAASTCRDDFSSVTYCSSPAVFQSTGHPL